ncbi:hypothetical protein BDY24DRAFT_387305 [Mrakia frigida]|uniref:FYVE, RhoGEF and PH domain-containing protein n=1 Tax=Mrakia frigida TaxID=29902 RepID=UPI003FCBFE34
MRNSSSPSLRRTSFPSLQKPNRASIASVLSCDYVLPEEQPSTSPPPLPLSTFPSSPPPPLQFTSPGSPSSITFPTCASPLHLSRPSSSLSHHRLSRTYSTPTVPPASMLFAVGGSTSPPARASTGISTGMGPGGGRVRAQSPSLLSGVGRAVGGGRVLTRARTMMGLPDLARGGGGVGESLEDEVSRKKYEKRAKVIKEIWESEKVYVEGLEVIIKHFLNPLLATSEDPYPILPKKTIQELFHNITQIHSFSLTLLAGISTCLPLPLPLLSPSTTATSAPPHQLTTPISPLVPNSPSNRPIVLPVPDLPSSATSTLRSLSPRSSPRPLSLPAELCAVPPPPVQVIAPISKVLSEHAPFMSLYHPFISNFATSSKLLSDLRKEGGPFAKWLSERERHEGCKKLRLGDWLLSVVQRVPRYLLLIKDLLKCTPEEDLERRELEKVLEVVDKITETLNARLHDIAATQKLIALHRSFTSLPDGFSFVVPGRRLLKQGDLVKVCRRRDEDRTFWLFTDCLIYGTTASTSSFPLSSSRSVAGLSNWMSLMTSPAPQESSSFVRTRTKSESKPSHSPHVSMDFSTPAGEKGRFVFHRKLELEDLTVVGVEDSKSNQFSFELLSPDKSFAVVACSQEEKEEWMDAIRDARMELLSSLRTLKTDEEHTMRRHRRRSLQAMPFPSPFGPDYQASSLIPPPRSSTHPNHPSNDSAPISAGGGSFASSSDGTSSQTVESFIAAVWVPDSRTEKCMRCHEPFTVFRRRHHCRLCGLVCCHWCSTKTFTINDSTRPKSSAQPVRACDPCYAALFAPSSSSVTSPSSSLNRTQSSNIGPDRPPSLTNCSSQHSDSSAPSTPNDSAIPLPETPSDSSTPSRPTRPRTGASDSPTTSISSSSLAIEDSPFPPGLISNRRTSGLATLRLESPTTATSSDGQSDTRHRRLSGMNDRFSIFVGGGQGGADWGGRGEISSRGGGEVAYGAVAGRLRSVLRDQAARSGKAE